MARIAIFGTGAGGKVAADLFRGRDEIVAFADNDVAKQGRTMLGVRILSAAELVRIDVDRVVIASSYGFQIKPQLLALGIPRQKVVTMSVDELARPVRERRRAIRRWRRRAVLTSLILLLWWAVF